MSLSADCSEIKQKRHKNSTPLSILLQHMLLSWCVFLQGSMSEAFFRPLRSPPSFCRSLVLCALMYTIHSTTVKGSLSEPSLPPALLIPPLLPGVLFMSQLAGLWMSLPPFYAQLLQKSLECEGEAPHRRRKGKVTVFLLCLTTLGNTYKCCFLIIYLEIWFSNTNLIKNK